MIPSVVSPVRRSSVRNSYLVNVFFGYLIEKWWKSRYMVVNSRGCEVYIIMLRYCLCTYYIFMCMYLLYSVLDMWP